MYVADIRNGYRTGAHFEWEAEVNRGTSERGYRMGGVIGVIVTQGYRIGSTFTV